MTIQRGPLTRSIAVLAALFAAFAFAGTPGPASAAPSIAAFPDDSFRIKNPSQQNRCVTPNASYSGAMTLRACDDVAQFFFPVVQTTGTELLPLYGRAGDGYFKCLAADSANRAYLKRCDSTPNTHWTRIGSTIRNDATGRCLSGNSAGSVYTGVCDGAVNRNWTFPTTSLTAADAKEVQTARDARRAEPARAAG